MGVTHPDGCWLALDVGGANIKAAHERGSCLTTPFELWRDPSALPSVLRDLFARVPSFGRIALTMTAELCDCYATKAEGVRHVLDAVLCASRGGPVSVWCVDGCFRDVQAVSSRPALAAAANWLALAEVAARIIGDGSGLLIDIGSTTTDIIALSRGHAWPAGRTDTERLGTGELAYAGIRRTPVCALAHELPYRGRPTALAAELFATTFDVYLTLGLIAPDSLDRATADGRPSTVDSAHGRLARMIAADREDFHLEDALALAEAAHSALLSRLVHAAFRVADSAPSRPTSTIISGSGEFLARAVAAEILPRSSTLSLHELWGAEASFAACAHAVLLLALESSGSRA